ncbi:MAG: hypothetical protein HND53_11850 [Proteobacteria bacterium]|nr:hypothetical protein [Pseudomonadota bacterium]NOG61187.1 hypothetical protein [Pseudomonadota bacterium]
MKKLSSEKQKLLKKESTLIKKLDLHPDTEKVIKNAVHNFNGVGTTLESAIGAFLIGQFYGWRILRLIHGSTTYNKYEEILKIKFNDVCPEEGILARRSYGYRLTQKLNSFWKVATGKVKTNGKNKLIDDGSEEPEIPK